MKKFLVTLLVLAMMVPTFAIGASAAKTLQIPYASSAPAIDGKGDDEAWKNAYKITLNPTTALNEGGFVLKKSNTSDAATADISVVWSDGGLSFKWVVVDPTQSFALDLPQAEGLNSMDGVQVFLDPFNKKFTSIKNCAFCFDFVPYTAQRGSGVGQAPIGEASWFERWIWIGLNSSIGVQMKATLDSRPDDDNDGLDRRILVSGYTIEAYIPWTAMVINGSQPKIEPGKTQMGLGLSLIDYIYDHQKFVDNGNSAQASQILYNFCTDFGAGKDYTGKPNKYNTIVLMAKDGTVDTNTNATPYDALQTKITEAETYITNQANYTAATIENLKKVITEAKALTSSASEAECTAATEKLTAAIQALIPAAEDTLDNLIKACNSIVDNCQTENPYTAESWSAFTTALDAAKAVMAKEGFSEDSEEAKTAKANLEAAKLALVEKTDSTEMPDVTTLESAIASAEALKQADFTPSSYKAVQTALTNAKSVYESAKINVATQAEVNEAAEKLNTAINALVRVASAEDNTQGFPVWAIILIIVAVLAIAAAVVFIVIKKKKDSAAATPVEAQPTEEIPESEIVGDVQNSLADDTQQNSLADDENKQNSLSDDENNK